MNLKVFLDANIFFAAAASRTGGSYFVIELGKKNLIQIVTVAHALSESERNIQKKLGNPALFLHYENLLTVKPAVQSLVLIPPSLELKLGVFVIEKDLPIILGAFLCEADVLITLDKKHLLGNKALQRLNLPFAIMTPGDFVKKYIL